jgi:integrase
MKAIETIAARITTELGPEWRKCREVPIALLAPLCDVVYAAGMNPTQERLQSYLPLIYVTAFGPGIYAWRAEKGFSISSGPYSRKPAITLTDLARVVAEPISTAPQTSLDPRNDGRWAAPSSAVLSYVVDIENESLRNTMALFALIQAAHPTRQQHDHYRVVADLTHRVAKLMKEQSIEDVSTMNPDKLTYQVLQGQSGEGLTEYQRATVGKMWFHLRNTFDAYAERLPPAEADRMSAFFVQRITSRFRPATDFSLATYLRKAQDRVKAKVDAVHARLQAIRFVSTARLNQVRRLYEAAEAAVVKATAGKQALPFEFSYEETALTEKGRPLRQRVRLRLWDFVAAYDHSVILGLKPGSATRWKRRRNAGTFSAARNYYQVEYIGTESLDGKTTPTPFWFLEMYEEYLFSRRKDVRLAGRREAFCRRWGYRTKMAWHARHGLLFWRASHHDPWIHLRGHGYGVFLPFDGLRASTLMAHLIVRLQLITGARLGEVQQVAQNRDCIKQLVNVGPKGTTRWLLRMVPKGRKNRESYYIDEDTKDYLMKVVRFLRATGKSQLLPIVALERKGQPPDRYIFQWGGRILHQTCMNTLIRFLLHGLVFDTMDGKHVHISSHLLRHAFATELAELKVSPDVIAEILHQRDVRVTKYYSRPTRMQIMKATELVFVDRIDIAVESVRDPEGLGRLLKDAEGKVGALSEVLGGTCVVGNMCPAKFACIGCVGNVPDPAKRYQVERKRTWADEQRRWAARNGMLAEERQMKQLTQDCDMALVEMDLIQKARSDGSQLVKIRLREGESMP